MRKRIGFLSFGHWQRAEWSQTRTAHEALAQTVELAVAAEELARDAAVAAADTLLLTVPNQLGVDYNARLLGTIVEHVAPAIGWVDARSTEPEAV